MIPNPKRSRPGAFLGLEVVMALSTSEGFRFGYSHRFGFISGFAAGFASGSTVGSAIRSTIELAIGYVGCGNSVETKALHFSLKELAVFSTFSFT